MNIKVDAIDLFCGVGGLTYGLQKSGIDVKLGIDIEAACKYPFEANNNAKFLLKSVEKITTGELQHHFTQDSYQLLAGCQTFSNYNAKARLTDDRWWLLLQFSRLVEESLPDLVTMENVPGLIKQGVFAEFVKQLKQNGYNISYKIVNSADYGLPQSRKRLVLLASRLGVISLLTPAELDIKLQTVKDAISMLPPIQDGEIYPADPLHQSAALSPLNKLRIKKSKPGGTWKDWPQKLVAECHKKNSGKSYVGVYARMEWNKPSPTMTTQFFGFGNGRFGHPEQDRAISLREGAIFQGFPIDYKFLPEGERIFKGSIGKMIGNAVPVKLGEVIGKSIMAHIKDIQSLKSSTS
ncbi:MAG: DNA (cytosine-5-)-methyltransferase [Methylophaga sp.]|nr:DNA (cytosine-5-)-methyltransferase [Methylophaga sp.]